MKDYYNMTNTTSRLPIHICLTTLVVCSAITLSPAQDAPKPIDQSQVSAPPPELVEQWKLSPFYGKHISVDGLPVLSSANVSDYALSEAAFLIRQMAAHRPEILPAMAGNRVRFVIMAPDEMTTDVPEHSDLKPSDYWDRRARGLGATPHRPAVSCGEENLLELRGDPYSSENILIHEFAHAMHQMGMNTLDPTFDDRLKATYQRAKEAGLWRGTYAMENYAEYWAEGVQSWFDCNRANDNEHGPIDTRDKLRGYDTGLAELLEEVYGDTPWRYIKPSKRPADQREHLAGFDPATAGKFVWPAEISAMNQSGKLLSWTPREDVPAASPQNGTDTTLLFVNQRKQPVSVYWLDFGGNRKHYADIRPGFSHLQNTYAGHAWIVTEGETPLGTITAVESPGRIEVK